MKERLADWLDAAGFEPGLAIDELDVNSVDDPWADVVVAIASLSTDQRGFVAGEIALELDDPWLTAGEVGAANADIIAIPSDPSDVEPFTPDD